MNLYLQEGTQIIVGKSEYLREKMYLLRESSTESSEGQRDATGPGGVD